MVEACPGFGKMLSEALDQGLSSAAPDQVEVGEGANQPRGRWHMVLFEEDSYSIVTLGPSSGEGGFPYWEWPCQSGESVDVLWRVQEACSYVVFVGNQSDSVFMM